MEISAVKQHNENIHLKEAFLFHDQNKRPIYMYGYQFIICSGPLNPIILPSEMAKKKNL